MTAVKKSGVRETDVGSSQSLIKIKKNKLQHIDWMGRYLVMDTTFQDSWISLAKCSE